MSTDQLYRLRFPEGVFWDRELQFKIVRSQKKPLPDPLPIHSETWKAVQAGVLIPCDPEPAQNTTGAADQAGKSIDEEAREPASRASQTTGAEAASSPEETGGSPPDPPEPPAGIAESDCRDPEMDAAVKTALETGSSVEVVRVQNERRRARIKELHESHTVAELKQMLETLGIEYDSRARKAELVRLVADAEDVATEEE